MSSWQSPSPVSSQQPPVDSQQSAVGSNMVKILNNEQKRDLRIKYLFVFLFKFDCPQLPFHVSRLPSHFSCLTFHISPFKKRGTIIFKKKYKHATDEQLIEFIQQGETAAFDELYQRYSERLLYFFYRMLGGDEDRAQDFLQDLFLKIIEKPNQFVSKQRFSNWIFAVAHNMCKNEYRRLSVRQIIGNTTSLDSVADGKDDNFIEQQLDQKIFENQMLKELKKLNPDYQTTFLLRFQENRSIKEISEILDCSAGTIKSRLFHTTKKLMERLKAFNPNQVEV